MIRTVVDASVVCKCIFQEELSAEAQLWIDADALFSAPDFILAECANVTRKKVTSKEIMPTTAKAVLHSLPQWFESLTPLPDLYKTAFEMACQLQHPIYDCLYLALAQNSNTMLLTADQAFARRVRRSHWKDQIRLLGETRPYM